MEHRKKLDLEIKRLLVLATSDVVNLDVYTELGWESHLAQEKRRKEEKKNDIISLDDDKNEPVDVPKQICLILQSSTKGKLKLKVLEVIFSTLNVPDSDCNNQEDGECIQDCVQTSGDVKIDILLRRRVTGRK